MGEEIAKIVDGLVFKNITILIECCFIGQYVALINSKLYDQIVQYFILFDKERTKKEGKKKGGYRCPFPSPSSPSLLPLTSSSFSSSGIPTNHVDSNYVLSTLSSPWFVIRDMFDLSPPQSGSGQGNGRSTTTTCKRWEEGEEPGGEKLERKEKEEIKKEYFDHFLKIFV